MLNYIKCRIREQKKDAVGNPTMVKIARIESDIANKDTLELPLLMHALGMREQMSFMVGVGRLSVSRYRIGK